MATFLSVGWAAVYCTTFGMWCSILAMNRGRDWLIWLLLGASCGLFALIILLCLPNLQTKEDQLHPLVDVD
ncbi:MAG TPA: hypothetical protein VGP50_12265 [Stellaceae bacterium]|jgi:hypothetical protein|nr:hypothetical protein [Stellaceae bacterium]